MPAERKMHRYPECGLDNVWLVNGFTRRRTPYGEAIAIEDVEGLHASIARGLVAKARTLGGKEVRFLRKHLGQSQRQLGETLGYDEQTLSRWERGESAIPPAADRLLRAYHREVTDGDARLQELVQRLAEHDDRRAEKRLRLERGARARGQGKAWRLAA